MSLFPSALSRDGEIGASHEWERGPDLRHVAWGVCTPAARPRGSLSALRVESLPAHCPGRGGGGAELLGSLTSPVRLARPFLQKRLAELSLRW